MMRRRKRIIARDLVVGPLIPFSYLEMTKALSLQSISQEILA
jgi:hypothetical protein